MKECLTDDLDLDLGPYPILHPVLMQSPELYP